MSMQQTSTTQTSTSTPVAKPKASRASFGEALVELGAQFQNLVVLDADLSKSTKTDGFAKKYPDRFFQMGIQEQNMIGVAAGLAFNGKVPFIASFSCFLTGRFDVIRMSVGYSAANVRLVGTHSGIGIGEDGYSQMALEDIACMRTLPNMAVLQPCDDIETKQMVRYLMTHQGPAFLRLTRHDLLTVNSSGYQFKFGKAPTVYEPGASDVDAVVFATGALTGNSVEAAKMLGREGLKIAVVNVHTIKPLDVDAVVSWGRRAKILFTAEDHNIIGGLGGAVAEAMAENSGLKARLCRIGVRDTYGESGTPEGLYEKHGLDVAGVARQIKSNLSF